MFPSRNENVFTSQLSNFYTPDELYHELDASVPDDKLYKMVVASLDEDIAYWNRAPFNLQEADNTNINFWLGEQWEKTPFTRPEDHEIDNRLFSGVRAILSYATARMATPEIVPSSSDTWVQSQARNLQMALYQHSMNEGADKKFRAAVLNLLTRKRAFLKLRFDPFAGMHGDIITEVCDPSDIVVDRFARFRTNPNKIYHRIRCTLDELCTRFPDKQNDIYRIFNIKKGVYTQLSRYVTYYECWFTYIDPETKQPREGLCSFLHEPGALILDKGVNPNWVYTGDESKDKFTNVMFAPPKPFVTFNYLSLGLSFIDETSLFDQARPLQVLLNKRERQWHSNIDYANGRWVAASEAMSEETATKMVNKGSKTIGLIKTKDVGGSVTNAFANVSAQSLPQEVYESIIDLRNEIDEMLGKPGFGNYVGPQKQTSATRDIMSKQQSGMMQDDLVRAVQDAAETYYQIKLQLMRVYYTEDYSFQAKGGDGKFNFISITGESIDPNVKVGVQIDSTLPLDKSMIRTISQELLTANKIDYLTAMEDMGLPNPEIRTERYFKSTLQPFVYLQSVEKGMDNNEAEMDIQTIISNKQPRERDNYDQNYLAYYGLFITTNRFAKLQREDPEAARRVISFLSLVRDVAERTANLSQNMLDAAGMQDSPPFYPPKVSVRLQGKVDDNAAASMAGGQLPPPPTPSNEMGQAEAPQQPGGQEQQMAQMLQMGGM